jgi:hypothetical protein
LPDAIPFVHNGFELHEQLPVNTGLNFTRKEIDFFSRLPLPLFYKNKLDWEAQDHILSFITSIQQFRETYPWVFDKSGVVELLETQSKISGLKIIHENNEAVALFNLDFRKKSTIQSPLITGKYIDLFTSELHEMPKILTLPGGGVFLGIRK